MKHSGPIFCQSTSTGVMVQLYLLIQVALAIVGVSVSATAYSAMTLASSPSWHTGLHFSGHNDGSSVDTLASLVSNYAHQMQQDPHRRRLAASDYASLNAFFQDAKILLPDTQFNQSAGIGDITITLTNMSCSNIQVGDIVLTASNDANQSMTIHVEFTEATMDCNADFSYDYSFLNGAGSAAATTTNNQLTADLIFTSPNFSTSPPTAASISNCAAVVNVDNLDISGGVVSSIADLFHNAIGGFIEKQVQNVACDQLSALGSNLTSMLAQANAKIDVFLQPLPANETNPLAAQKQLEASTPSTVTFVNFMSNENFVLTSIQNLLEQYVTAMGDLVDDSNSPTGTNQDLQINVFLRQQLLDSQRAFAFNNITDVFPLPELGTENKLIETNMTIDSVKIYGLDTVSVFEPLNFIGNQTIQNKLAWDYLRFEANLTLLIQPPTMNNSMLVDPTPMQLIEPVNITIEIQNITIDLTVLLAIDQDKLLSLMLGSLMRSQNLMGCVLSVLNTVELSGLGVTIGAIQKPTVSGMDSPGLANLVTTMIGIAFDMYEPTVLRIIPNVFQTKVRKMINTEIIGKLLANETTTNCPAPVITSESIDLRDLMLEPDVAKQYGGSGNAEYGDMFPKILTMVKTNLLQTDPNTSLASQLNQELIDPMTKDQWGQAGSFRINGSLVDSSSRLNIGSLDAKLRLQANNVHIDNIDSVGAPLALLENVNKEPYMLNNSATIGVGNPLQLGMHLYFALSDEGANFAMSNDMDISLNLDRLSAVIAALIAISENNLMNFPLGDALNLNCWLATIPAPPLTDQGMPVDGHEPSLSLAQLEALVASAGLNVTCHNCTSPMMADLISLLATSEGSQGVTDAMNDILAFVTNILRSSSMQTAIDRMLKDAENKCKGGDTTATYAPFQLEAVPTDSGIDPLFRFLIFIVCAAAFVAFIALLTRVIVRRRHQKWIGSLSKDHILLVWYQQTKERESRMLLNSTTSSMVTSSVIPFFVRLVIPFVILGNIALFLSGHLNLGASVQLIISVAGQTLTAGNFFEFSMIKSSAEIWNAGGRALAALIFIFSIIWPYVKQVTTMILWFSPPRIVSVTTRGTVLHWLDALAKWSMVDIFVLVFTIVGFRISIQSPQVSFLPQHFYSIDLMVVPVWGLYANMIAQLISQISSHIIIHYHNRVIEAADKSNAIINKRKSTASSVGLEDVELGDETTAEYNNDTSLEDIQVPLCDYAYARPHRAEAERVKAKSFVNPVLAITAFVSGILILLGTILPSMSIDILGLIGILVSSGQRFQQPITNFSLFTMIRALFEQAAFSGRIAEYIGLGSLSILLVLTVVIVPIVQLVVLLWLWFRPMSRKLRNRLSVATEILFAWEYVDVFLIAILVASWQLGPVSQFMVSDHCSNLDGLFSRLVYYGIINEKDAQCFRVDANILSGAILLITGVTLLFLVDIFVTKAVRQNFRDQTTSARELSSIDSINDEDISEISRRITPPPVLFSDSFRWLLHGTGSAPSSVSETNIMHDKETAGTVGMADSVGRFSPHTSEEDMEDIYFSEGRTNENEESTIETSEIYKENDEPITYT